MYIASNPGDEGVGRLEAEEGDRLGHSVSDVGTKVGNLVVDVGQERQARRATCFHDSDQVATIEFHGHCPTGSKRV